VRIFNNSLKSIEKLPQIVLLKNASVSKSKITPTRRRSRWRERIMIAFALKCAVLALWTAAMATLIALYARDAFSLEKPIQSTCIDRAFSFGDEGELLTAKTSRT
jgi:hypothetical protein